MRLQSDGDDEENMKIAIEEAIKKWIEWRRMLSWI